MERVMTKKVTGEDQRDRDFAERTYIRLLRHQLWPLRNSLVGCPAILQ